MYIWTTTLEQAEAAAAAAAIAAIYDKRKARLSWPAGWDQTDRINK
jgi:hypothetical protein